MVSSYGQRAVQSGPHGAASSNCCCCRRWPRHAPANTLPLSAARAQRVAGGPPPASPIPAHPFTPAAAAATPSSLPAARLATVHSLPRSTLSRHSPPPLPLVPPPPSTPVPPPLRHASRPLVARNTGAPPARARCATPHRRRRARRLGAPQEPAPAGAASRVPAGRRGATGCSRRRRTARRGGARRGAAAARGRRRPRRGTGGQCTRARGRAGAGARVGRRRRVAARQNYLGPVRRVAAAAPPAPEWTGTRERPPRARRTARVGRGTSSTGSHNGNKVSRGNVDEVQSVVRR